VIRQNTFIKTAFLQSQIKENAFSFKLARRHASLFIGGSDKSLYTGTLEYHKVNDASEWQIPGTQLLVGSTIVVPSFVANMDR
jgi:cathepsin D